MGVVIGLIAARGEARMAVRTERLWGGVKLRDVGTTVVGSVCAASCYIAGVDW